MLNETKSLLKLQFILSRKELPPSDAGAPISNCDSFSNVKERP